MLSQERVDAKIRNARSTIVRYLGEIGAELGRIEMIDLTAEGGLEALDNRAAEIETLAACVLSFSGTIQTLIEVRDAR